MWDSTQQTIKENYSIQIVKNNINKYSMDRKTTTTFIQATDKTCRFCVCSDPLCQENFWNAWRDQGYIQINMVLSNWTPNKNSAIQ